MKHTFFYYIKHAVNIDVRESIGIVQKPQHIAKQFLSPFPRAKKYDWWCFDLLSATEGLENIMKALNVWQVHEIYDKPVFFIFQTIESKKGCFGVT